jgi:hypothetical protein
VTAKFLVVPSKATRNVVVAERDITMGVLLFQLSALVSGTGWFAGGVQHRGVGCKQLIVGSARRRTARSSAAL